ncbi:MAG: toll/interleukin-1 receptor domain-containing protein [Planctomycetaceae bacterium]
MASNFFIHSLLHTRDWQHRPQLDTVCAWWRNGGHGVLALVGVEGARKTAIVERFLRVLPGGLTDEFDIPKDETLPRPYCVFVFSFSEAARPEKCFESLETWLKRSPKSKKGWSSGQVSSSIQQSSRLLVLDSLEKVPNHHERHAEGFELANFRLNRLLTQIANGHLPNVSVLLTSRFELSCLAPKASRYNPPVVVPPYCLSVLKKNLKHHFHNHPKGKAGCFVRLVGRQLSFLTLRVAPLGLLTDPSNRKRLVSTTIEKESAERLGQNHPPKPLDSNMYEKKRKVFVSHSSVDKQLVERIVKELESRDLQVWFDKYEMGVGDSIVQGIDQGLSDADYFLLILSPNSVKSNWVQRELNAALMEETSKRGIVVLPAIIKDCEIPTLLKDRIYADFRSDFDIGLNGLLRVLKQESATALSIEPDHKVMFASSDCKSNLSALSLAELRRRMSKRMGRSEVGTVWFDVFESLMDNDMIGRTLTECVVELLDRAKNRNKLADVIVSVCSERDDIGNP